jgi:hypothetical protein
MDDTDSPDSAGGGAPPKPPGPPREAVYQALWVSYRDGVREKRALIRLHRLSWAVVNHAVELGWPEAGFPALAERAALWDRQTLAAKQTELAVLDRAAAEAKGRKQAARWDTFQPKALALAEEGHDILSSLALKLREAAGAMTFTRYRRVRKVDPATGQVVVTDQVYVDGMAMAHATKLFTAAARENANLVAFLAGGPLQDPKVPELTDEQLAVLEQGRLPDGMTLEQVAAAVMANATKESTGE